MPLARDEALEREELLRDERRGGAERDDDDDDDDDERLRRVALPEWRDLLPDEPELRELDELELEPEREEEEDADEPEREDEEALRDEEEEAEREREPSTEEEEDELLPLDEDDPERLLPDDEDDPEEDPEEDPLDEEQLGVKRGGGITGKGAFARARLGALARCSRMPSVSPPRPMAVQKLIAKRVFFAVSSGKRPANDGCMCGSASLAASCLRPMNSATSWKRTLMKMREEDVVSSSVMIMYSSAPHGSASECNRCAKNLATLRSLLVSSRWIIEYCLANASSKSAWYVAEIQQKRSPSDP